jgi:hypothetical protein
LKESHISEQDVANLADTVISGNDALTQEPIQERKLAAMLSPEFVQLNRQVFELIQRRNT